MPQYQTFYVGSPATAKSFIDQGFGSQPRTVTADSHHDAVCQSAKFSEHSAADSHYLVVGVETDKSRRPIVFADEQIARLYKLTKVLNGAQRADFTTTTSYHGRYVANEVCHFGPEPKQDKFAELRRKVEIQSLNRDIDALTEEVEGLRDKARQLAELQAQVKAYVRATDDVWEAESARNQARYALEDAAEGF